MNNKLFTVTDSAGGYHAFDPARVNTITTYKVNGQSNEFRCEVRVGREADQQGSNEQLFLIRQNSMIETAALAEKIKKASDDAKAAQHLVPEMVYISNGAGIDPATIAYIKKNIPDTVKEGVSGQFVLNLALKFTSEHSRSYSYGFDTVQELDTAYDILVDARNRISFTVTMSGGDGFDGVNLAKLVP